MISFSFSFYFVTFFPLFFFLATIPTSDFHTGRCEQLFSSSFSLPLFLSSSLFPFLLLPPILSPILLLTPFPYYSISASFGSRLDCARSSPNPTGESEGGRGCETCGRRQRMRGGEGEREGGHKRWGKEKVG